MTAKDNLLNVLIKEFSEIIGDEVEFTDDYLDELVKISKFLSNKKKNNFNIRKENFIAHVNWKFRINSNQLKKFYSTAASNGITFNYHQKNIIQYSFDSSSINLLEQLFKKINIAGSKIDVLLKTFKPASLKETRETIVSECNSPAKLRIPKGSRNIKNEILEALFSAFLYSSFSHECLHEYFDPDFSLENYKHNFFEQLHVRSPELFKRDHSLHFIAIDQNLPIFSLSYIEARTVITNYISECYNLINNYGYLAILITPIFINNKSVQWELISDIILFSEKFREVRLKKNYFRPDEIQKITSSYIENLDIETANFDIANEGFTYKDCFVISKSNELDKQDLTDSLLIFQKNDRDETLIPCPTCRTRNVQGNSYPSFGVRSWECKNRLCPDKSKYNRGKRYSFKAIISQQAIDDEANSIPEFSVRSWMRDVQNSRPIDEIFEMLLRHYSLNGDGIHVTNYQTTNKKILGRTIKFDCLPIKKNDNLNFFNSSFFNRYIVQCNRNEVDPPINLGDSFFNALHGDTFNVLKNYNNDFFDGAITSPPYYNAREYSQWENIYCYLYDMYNINAEVYRCLKPGALYLYNIFDYFDNEKSTAFSAMGQKRMILSAYTVDIFRRIGFDLAGNIVWDKGDIEGKRGFNSGNFSPYYQAPFNCWEHILIFKKPSSTKKTDSLHLSFPSIFKQKPVIKMVNGANVHGHSAPFPDEIPELLIKELEPGSIVLDPFGGSLTTCRVAETYNISSVCIEKEINFCHLGIKLRKENKKQSILKQPALPFLQKTTQQ